MACFRLFTFPPVPPLPLLKLPRFRRRIALATSLLALLLYFRFRLLDFFANGILLSNLIASFLMDARAMPRPAGLAATASVCAFRRAWRGYRERVTG